MAEEQAPIVVVGAKARPLRDLYHLVLKARWPVLLFGIAAVYILLNLLFALIYREVGGVTGVESFRDAFFFSVQTMGTIGYGAMSPQSTPAHLVVVVQSVVGLITTALATGIIFARFSQTSGRIIFSARACIGPMNGVPTLMFRIGNDRTSIIFDAATRVVAVKTEKTAEGVIFYRMHDLALARERTPALTRSWTVLHPIDEKSPLYGATPESFVKDEVEIMVSVNGTDDTSLQPAHGRTRYEVKDIVWGARLGDVLSELPDGRLLFDMRKFHDLVPTEPSERFPYPRTSSD